MGAPLGLTISVQDLIGPGCAVLILCLLVFFMGKWIHQLIETRLADTRQDLKDIRQELRDCHAKHIVTDGKVAELSLQNAEIAGEVKVLRQLKTPEDFIERIVEGITKALEKRLG